MNPVVAVVLAAALLVAPGPAGLRRLGAGRSGARPRIPIPPAPVAAMAVGALVGGLLGGVAGAPAGAAAAEVVRRRRRRSRDRASSVAEAGELAESLARIVAELRGGAHPAAALDGVRADGPLAERTLAPAAAAARLGDDVPAALTRVAARGSTRLRAELHRTAAAWSLAERHGAPLAALLDGVLTDLRWRLAFEARTHARAAGARATASVLTALPLLGLGLGHLVGAAPLAVLRDGLLGQVLLLVGVALLLAGVTWADRLAAGSAS
ncbi:secretion system protein [Pseudonocardia xishanensis]|uniref:Tight adherence protein B n=1 Tax=Pseudonocardia xishanensis TaxID=630995 RepID=A0ABP8RPV1_9PSEU